MAVRCTETLGSNCTDKSCTLSESQRGGGPAKLNSLFMNEVKILPVEKTGHFHFSDCYFNFLFSVEVAQGSGDQANE